jgi:CHAD domain-containing protein
MTANPSWAEQSVEQLGSCFNRIRSQSKRLSNSHEPEALHQLRINLRRLRASVQAGSEALNLPHCLAGRSVARQGRPLGRLRDLDVLCEHLHAELLPQLDAEESPSLQGLIERLQRRQKRARRLTKAHLGSASFQQWQRNCCRWLREPQCTSLGERPLLEVLPDLQLRSLGILLLHQGWQAKDPHQDAEQLHDLRKCVKATRYQADGFRQFYGLAYGVWIDELRQLQDSLGGLQDLSVLRALLKHDLRQGLPGLEALIKGNEQKHWNHWLGLRGRYCSPESRQGLRELVVSCSAN